MVDIFHCCVVTPFSCTYSLSSPQPLILLSFSSTCSAGRVELSQRCESVPTVHALYLLYVCLFVCMFVGTYHVIECMHVYVRVCVHVCVCACVCV